MAGEKDFIGQLGKQLDAQLARGLRRWRGIRPKENPALIVEESPTVLGPWGSLVESVAVLAAEGARIPGAAEASKIIQALVGIEDIQVVMLKRIGRDVQLLREGPFHAAQEQLRIALRKGPMHADYGHHLSEAEDLLVSALGQAASIEEKSIVRFHLGVIEALRGDIAEARYRLKESFDDCMTVTCELSSRAGNVKVLKSRWSAAASAYAPFGIYVVAARKLLKVQKAQDAATALAAYVPFVNTVARAGNAIDQTAKRPGLILRGSSDQGYELEWTKPLSVYRWKDRH